MKLRLPLLLMALAVTHLASGEEVDPPGRVARISYLQGNVSFQAEDAQAPEPAVLNRPLTTGDRLLTEDDARAELSVGVAAVRLDSRTDISIANLDLDIAQIEVNSGSMSLHLRELDTNDAFEIDTPNATVRILKPGDYRVDVAPDGSATLSVRRGDAEIDGGEGPVGVHEQQIATLGPQERFANVVVLGAPDQFDDWGLERERQINESQSSKYVSRDVVGYEDLDNYGTWYDEPEYGHVWAPTTIAVGWSPYSYGRWTWISPWGWSWIDDAPWGFAPFHYGRWAHVRDRWCWVPGPRHRRSVYAPALVSWHGSTHVGVGFSQRYRPSRWQPLGPRDVYVPGHRVSPRYLRNVNVSNAHIRNNSQITHAYRNQYRPGVNIPDARRNGRDSPYERDARNGAQNSRDMRWRTEPRLERGEDRSGTNDRRNYTDRRTGDQIRRSYEDRRNSAGDGNMRVPRNPQEPRSRQDVQQTRPDYSPPANGRPDYRRDNRQQTRPDSRPYQPPAMRTERRESQPQPRYQPPQQTQQPRYQPPAQRNYESRPSRPSPSVSQPRVEPRQGGGGRTMSPSNIPNRGRGDTLRSNRQ